jgi:Coenzyme PQQ synthesis protein D (PqqD)
MVRFSDSVRSIHSADGAVILDVRRGHIFRLNLTGSRILQLLRSGAEEPEIACMLVREFSANPATAESDTSVFLGALRQNALIEPESQR